MHSLLIRGASVLDGSGSPAQQADVAVDGDRIAAVAPRITDPAAEVVNASGLTLAPGFIDIHSHTDFTIFQYPLVESKITQGVTLEVTGNCGIGAFPVSPVHREVLADYLRMHGFQSPSSGLTWTTFSEYADALDRLSLGLNLAPLAAHGTLRIAVMGADDRAPTNAEQESLQRLLKQTLQEGAWGMSTGLIYPPGNFAQTDELIALGRVLAESDSMYTSHIRSEGPTLRAALSEALHVGSESRARVQVSHLKALGKANWGQSGRALATLDAARQSGLDVAADQYPYEATSTTLAAVVPGWAQAGGVEEMLKRLAAPELSERFRTEMRALLYERGGPAQVMIASVPSGLNRHLSGKSLAQVGMEWNVAPEEAARRLLLQERGAIGAVYFSLSEEDVNTIMACPWIAIGSDGHGLSAADSTESTHPRSYGTFPRVLGRYVREKGVLPLPLAIHKMTQVPAERLGLTDRGLVRPGYAADLVLFDPTTVRDRASFEYPHQYAEGITDVFVNGRAVIRNSQITGEAPGRVLRKRA